MGKMPINQKSGKREVRLSHYLFFLWIDQVVPGVIFLFEEVRGWKLVKIVRDLL
jgi:hypothetical protein